MAKAGAPTKYKPEFCDDIIKFYSRDCCKVVEGKLIGIKLPTLVEFAKHIKVGVSTVYDWVNPDHGSYQKIFSDIYKKKVVEMQKNALIQGGLLGYYNPYFCKFVSTNLTDMRDQQDVKLDYGKETLDKFKDMKPDELKRKAKEMSDGVTGVSTVQKD